MKKSRAILLLITLLVVIGGYVAWAAWQPAPTLQSMKFYAGVNADARSAAVADFNSHPPKVRRIALNRLLDRLTNPYLPRQKPPTIGIIRVENRLLIAYPREDVCLELNQDGKWHRAWRIPKGSLTAIPD